MAKQLSKYPDKETTKKLFMDSPHYTWREFCESMEWNPKHVWSKYPVNTWVQEKIGLQNEAFGAEIDGIMAEQSENWYVEVGKTLREYPKMIDSVSQIVKYRSNQYLAIIQKDLKNKTDEFRKVSTSEIRHLTMAAKQLTEAKYQSLLLSEVKVKEFERKPTGEGRIVFEIAGGGDTKNIKKIMEDWNNK